MTARHEVFKGHQAKAATARLQEFDVFEQTITVDPKSALEKLEAERLLAVQQGYEEGLEQAQLEIAAAMEDANNRVRRTLAALSQAIDEFDNRQAVAIVEVENEIVKAAFQLAQAILQRELATASDPGAEAIARALAMAPSRGEMLARLNPQDVETLSMTEFTTPTRTITVVADMTVEPGGCIIEVDDATIDSRISSILERVRGSLSLSDEEPIDNTGFDKSRSHASRRFERNLIDNVEDAGSDLPHSRMTVPEAPLA